MLLCSCAEEYIRAGMQSREVIVTLSLLYLWELAGKQESRKHVSFSALKRDDVSTKYSGFPSESGYVGRLTERFSKWK